MRLLVINPNTTASMTDKIGRAAQAVAAPGTEIVAVNPAHGPVSIEGYYDEAFSLPGLLEEIAKGEAAAVKLLESLAVIGLRTSKTGGYAAPLAKSYRGDLARFAPKA